MKRTTLVWTGVAGAIVIALGAGFAYSAATSTTLVSTSTAAVAPLRVSVSASGSLVPRSSGGVYPPAAGTLAWVKVADGDTVTAGQQLAQLETGPLSLAVAQARAAHSAAQAQLEAVNNAVPSAIDRSAVAAAVSAARSQVSTAAKNYADYLAQYQQATGEVRQTMTSTLRTLKTAKASANAALTAAKAATSKLSRAARVSAARRAAQQAVSATATALNRARHTLAAATLTAPFSGTVSAASTIEPGAAVTPGVAAFRVVNPAQLEFEASVSETDVVSVHPGQPATISLDAFPQPFTGTVKRVAATPQTNPTQTVTFAVPISFEALHARLFESMTGSAEIEVRSIPDALTVPIEAVISQGEAKTVFVLEAGVARARTVKVGDSTDTAVQILSGLAAGDRVITTGATGLSDGQPVRTQ